jgi:hypothetical protein
MAGLSSRFTRAGFDLPKYMLPLAGRPLLDWSILSFARYLDAEPVLFIYRDVQGTGDFVRERAGACGVREPRLVELSAPTAGQADTVRLGVEGAAVGGSEPLTIFNIDTLRPGLAVPAEAEAAPGYLETFAGEGDHWSFVEPDPADPGRARRVVEKVRVSDLCCTGLYRFARTDLFLQAFEAEKAAPSAAELYVAPLYNSLIARGLEVRHAAVPPEALFFSGTPEEYAAARAAEPAIRRAFAPATG